MGVRKIYGYSDNPHEPPALLPADQVTVCLYCDTPIATMEEITDVILVPHLPEGVLDTGRVLGLYRRQFFYRVHEECLVKASHQERQAINQVVIDSIIHHGDGWPRREACGG